MPLQFAGTGGIGQTHEDADSFLRPQRELLEIAWRKPRSMRLRNVFSRIVTKRIVTLLKPFQANGVELSVPG